MGGQPTEKKPTLAQICDAGMGITEALAFWNELANQPDLTAVQWWAELRRRVSARRGSRVQ